MALIQYLRSKCCFISLLTSLKPHHLITQRRWHPQQSSAADNPRVAHFCTEWTADKAPPLFPCESVDHSPDNHELGILSFVYVLQI